MAQEEATYVMRPVRVKHDNSEPRGGALGFNMGAGTKDFLFTLGAIGVGAVGGYYLIDYVMKKGLGDILPAPEEDTGTVPAGTSGGTSTSLAKIEIQEPFDRYTKVNSYQAQAYRGEKPLARLPVIETLEDEEPEEIEGQDDLAFNQVFTEDRVYEVTE